MCADYNGITIQCIIKWNGNVFHKYILQDFLNDKRRVWIVNFILSWIGGAEVTHQL